VPPVATTRAPLIAHGAAAERSQPSSSLERRQARRTEAAVGNRYEETVYAMPGTSPCVAVRYFIHWTIIENYPPGAVTAFDRQALLDRFDAMRGTLVLVR